MALSVDLNGTTRRFDALASGATLLQLVGALELKSDRVALEHNGEIAPRASWSERSVAEGDRIELVHFVGGGCDWAGGSGWAVGGNERV